MVLRIGSDGAHLVAPKARSRGGGYRYLGDKTGSTSNAPPYILAKVLKHVCASAAETELAAIYANAREAAISRQALRDMGHQQGPTPIKTDNTTAQGILTGNMKAKYLKGADMQLNWMKDRVEQGQYDVYWGPAATNLADYPTKHHPPTHHRTVRPIYTHQGEQSPTTMQGCVNILKGLAATRHKSPAGNPEPGEATASLPSLHAPLREKASLPSLRSSPQGREARKPLHIKRLVPRASRVRAITRKC